jgi:hypothetical protein
MKKIVAILVAGLFSAPAKKEEPKKDAKPAAAAPAAKDAKK